VENQGESWHRDTAKRIGEAIAARRKTLGITAQQLAERCKHLGVPIHRTTITKIENGRPRFDVGELLVLAVALDVPPVLLLFPGLPDGEVERLPGDRGTSEAALWWFTGEHDDPGELAADDPAWLLKLTRERYTMISRALRQDEYIAQRATRGEHVSDDEIWPVIDYMNQIKGIERWIAAIPGAVIRGQRNA